MKYTFVLILLFCCQLSFGQNAVFPEIKKTCKTVKEFVPPNWKVIETQYGDLNHDNKKDVVLVLQCKDHSNIVANDSSTDTVDKNPRMLLIAFKDSIADRYDLIEQSNTFILTHSEPAMDEPFQGIKISKNILQLNFHIWYSAGSWYTTNASYKFRYQNNHFELIGFDKVSFHRSSGEMEEVNINFSTKKMTTTKGNMFDEKVKNDTACKSVECNELKTFATFTHPFSWDFEGQQL